MKNISILGSSGSIGTQALDVVRNNSEDFKVVGLAVNKNIDLLYDQILEFNPQVVCVMDEKCAHTLKKMLGNSRTEVLAGLDGLISVATLNEADTVLVAVMGMIGLIPTLKAIECNKRIALANKETIVAGGPLVREASKKSNTAIIPVDSEHSAIFQCLQSSQEKKEVERILITASGGPFRGRRIDELSDVTPEQAIAHPNWNMGKKISVDSATLMNKGLEVIEAHWLFEMDFDKIDVVIHPESIIHSMVEYVDGSVIGQLGETDMRIPIMYALSYPMRMKGTFKKLNLIDVGKLTFEEPDYNTFRCLKLAYEAGKRGGTMPAVLNAANEVAVDLFLQGKIKFLHIPDIVEQSMMNHICISNPSLDDILEADSMTRSAIKKVLKVVSP